VASILLLWEIGFVTTGSLQAETLRRFTALRLMRERWGGVFVLGVGLTGNRRATALATLGVGAAGLFLEGDSAVLRAAMRDGCCSFVVTSLDEALRALKNELRQGRAITVGLGGEPARWLEEMVERGVVPDFVLDSGLGAGLPDGWRVEEDAAASLAERRARDVALAASADGVMRDWLRVAGSLFPRETARAIIRF
jgi:urocanate hydratase